MEGLLCKGNQRYSARCRVVQWWNRMALSKLYFRSLMLIINYISTWCGSQLCLNFFWKQNSGNQPYEQSSELERGMGKTLMLSHWPQSVKQVVVWKLNLPLSGSHHWHTQAIPSQIRQAAVFPQGDIKPQFGRERSGPLGVRHSVRCFWIT